MRMAEIIALRGKGFTNEQIKIIASDEDYLEMAKAGIDFCEMADLKKLTVGSDGADKKEAESEPTVPIIPEDEPKKVEKDEPIAKDPKKETDEKDKTIEDLKLKIAELQNAFIRRNNEGAKPKDFVEALQGLYDSI